MRLDRVNVDLATDKIGAVAIWEGFSGEEVYTSILDGAAVGHVELARVVAGELTGNIRVGCRYNVACCALGEGFIWYVCYRLC